jgi:hypothetical protein
MQVRERGAQPLLSFWVQAGGRFIEQEQLGRSKQGARNRQTLPHAPRKCADQIIRAAPQPDRRERLPRARDWISQIKELCEKDEILLGGELVVDKSVVGDHSDAVLYFAGGECGSARGERKLAPEGRASSAVILSSVVLPEPLWPTSATHSPAPISSETPRRAMRIP